MIHFYSDIAKCFASQAATIALKSSEADDATTGIVDSDFPPADWWRALEVEPLDPSASFDIGLHGSGNLDHDLYNFTGMGFFERTDPA